MEEKHEVKTFLHSYKCPKCLTGYLQKGGTVWDSQPPSYEHTCNNEGCKFSTMLDKAYPYFSYQQKLNNTANSNTISFNIE